jgi:hypothetical protein
MRGKERREEQTQRRKEKRGTNPSNEDSWDKSGESSHFS